MYLNTRLIAACFASLACLNFAAGMAHAQTRLKDVAVVQGVRGNQLVGYGLVVGLDGSGDGTGSTFTPQSVATMLQRFGINIVPGTLKLKNVAAVMVTASLPPFVKNGSAIDVTISSLGDAKSLQGGTLLQTPLLAANQKVYAVAQGALSVGGFLAGGGGAGADSVSKNHVTVGRIPGGALVEQDVTTTYAGAATNSLSVTLSQPDFTTASRIAKSLRAHLPEGATAAHAMDAATVQVDFTPGTDMVTLISDLETTPIDTDQTARIVINERTGTVVMGGRVTVSACAVAHGSLTVRITDATTVSQPEPLSKGETVVVPHKTVEVREGAERLIPIVNSATIDKVVNSLNALGVTPRDLIAILQAMKAAGALHADIEIE